MKSALKSHAIVKNSFLKKSFLVTGLGFVAICVIGFIVNSIIDSYGVLKNDLDNTTRLNFQIYSARAAALKRLARISFFGMGVIVVSSLLNVIWAFRFLKASKTFIYSVFSFYILGQGIGFGILFTIWKSIDLLIIFGISGGIFLIMGVIGYTSKNLLPLGKWLMIGSIFAFILLFVNMFLFFGNVYNDTFSFFVYSFLGFLILGWIAYDVWSIKKTSEYINMVGGLDEMMEFRLIMWAGFKLLSDLIALIWIIARFYARAK